MPSPRRQKKMRDDPLTPITQPELLPVEHRSLHQKRLRALKTGTCPWNAVNCEAIWAGEWRKYMREDPNFLGRLLVPDSAPAKRDWAGRVRPVVVTRRDAAVVASIIQWLGTNVGNGFVTRCQQRVNDALARHVEISAQRRRARGQPDDRTPVQRRRDRLHKTRARLAASARVKEPL